MTTVMDECQNGTRSNAPLRFPISYSPHPPLDHPAQWRNRIVRHGEEAPEGLLANPLNWRIHPKFQQDALQGVLVQVGWVQNVIVNERTGHLVDGHARVALAISAGEPLVPVTYVDLSDSEERLILATLDPLSMLAVVDKELLAETAATALSPTDDATRQLIDDTLRSHGIEPGGTRPIWMSRSTCACGMASSSPAATGPSGNRSTSVSRGRAWPARS